MPDYRKAARKAARKHGIREDVFLRMIQQESGFNPDAVSPAGAKGIAQFMPATAKGYGVNLSDGRVTDDLDGAAKYIANNLRRTGGNYTQALSIYNSGRPDGYKHISETANYVKTILGGLGKAPATDTSKAIPASGDSASGMPGVDRRQILAQYLLQRGRPGALTEALLSLQQETPSSASTPAPTQTAPANHGDGSTDIEQLLRVAKRDFGLTIREHPSYDKVDPVHAQGSYHYRKAAHSPGAAGDLTGTPRQMAAFAEYVARNYGADVDELIYRGKGGRTVKKGKRVPRNFYSGHEDHVHVADID